MTKAETTVLNNSTAKAISLLVATPGLLLLPVAVLEGNWADARHAGLWMMLGFAMWVVFRQCGYEAKALDDACEEIESLRAESAEMQELLASAVGGVGHLARTAGVNVAEWEQWESRAFRAISKARTGAAQPQADQPRARKEPDKPWPR